MNEYASRPCHSNIFAENVLPWGLQPLFEHERRYHLYNVNVALYTLVMIVRVYSYKDHDDRTPPLTFRIYQILPHTDSYFHSLYSYLDLPPQGGLGHLRGAKPPWQPRSYWSRSR